MPTKVKVLKPFPCAVEEHQVERLEDGAEVTLGAHFSKADVDGLVEAGLVKVVGKVSDDEAKAEKAARKSKAKA